MRSFRDHFGRKAEKYAQFRPTYPESLYEHLASSAPAHDDALDCATGSGQAAVALASYFRHVLAVDASHLQLDHVMSHERVSYALAYAEEIPRPDNSFDLVTAAAGAHWFDHGRFYPEMRRVLRPGGVLAVWSYFMFESEPGIDAVLRRYNDDIVHTFWPKEMEYNFAAYRTLPFPLEEISSPRFHAEAHWNMAQTLGFMSTWSASQRYEKKNNTNPVDLVRGELAGAWGNPGRVVAIRWPLHLRVGRFE